MKNILIAVTAVSLTAPLPAVASQALKVSDQEPSAPKARALSIPVQGLNNGLMGQLDVVLTGDDLTVIDFRTEDDRRPNDGRVTTYELFGATDAAGIPVPMANQNGNGSTAQVVYSSDDVTIIVVTTESGAEFVVTINHNTGDTTKTPA